MHDIHKFKSLSQRAFFFKRSPLRIFNGDADAGRSLYQPYPQFNGKMVLKL